MGKSLFLIRHAEAQTQGAGEKDFERELTNTGISDASRAGRKLFDLGIKLDMVISSSAIRAASTVQLICEQLKFSLNDIIFDKEVYEASVRSLLNLVNGIPSAINSLMIVGHNPVITYFAEYLTGEALGSVPTAGVVYIDFNMDEWEKISASNGALKSLERPQK